VNALLLSFTRLALLPFALAITVAAIGWWWWTFGEVIGYGYLSWREAGRCLVSDNDICSLAKALCLGSHPRFFYAYWTLSFWTGLALLSAGMLMGSPLESTRQARRD
jgi:hypothetical protein